MILRYYVTSNISLHADFTFHCEEELMRIFADPSMALLCSGKVKAARSNSLLSCFFVDRKILLSPILSVSY